jgi:hypothetical protein
MLRRIWFNHASSSVHAVLRGMRGGGRPRDFVVLSHASDDFGARIDCDLFVQEPRGLDRPVYVEWCLDFCARNRVDVFIPSRRRDAISDRRTDFEAGGTRLVVAGDGPTLRLLEDKSEFLRQLPPEVPTPWTRAVTDAHGFRRAIAEIRATGRQPCFKPARSIFGLGFHRIDDRMTPLKRLVASEPVRIAESEALAILDAAASFPELLVMEYLDGPEFSVDVAALDGEVLAQVVRRKPFSGRVRVERESTAGFVSGGRSQLIAPNPGIERLVAAVVARLRLGGICNIQFRSAATMPEVPKILEVNGRMSGGLGYAALAGIDLVGIAIDAALGTERPGTNPPPRPIPVRVQERSEFFVVGEPSHGRAPGNSAP